MTESDDDRSTMDQLKTMRDELKLKAHLFNMEMRDEWDALEGKLEDMGLDLDEAGDAAKEAAGDVGAATDLLFDELKKGYKKIKDAL